MIRIAITLMAVIALGACGDSDIPGEPAAKSMCSQYCDVCGSENEECFNTCVDQWALYAGNEAAGYADCATRYVIARECQAAMSLVGMGCSDPSCGDPYTDMVRCIGLLN